MKHLILNGEVNENYYLDKDGNVYTATREKMKQHETNTGYLRVKLSKGCKRGLYLVHRLVAETFISNEQDLPVVNHKNSIRNDNRVSNLEWCDNSHNQKQRFQNGHKGTKRKRVMQIELETLKVLNVFDSPIDAEKETGIARQNISKVCRNLRNHAGGFCWKYE